MCVVPRPTPGAPPAAGNVGAARRSEARGTQGTQPPRITRGSRSVTATRPFSIGTRDRGSRRRPTPHAGSRCTPVSRDGRFSGRVISATDIAAEWRGQSKLTPAVPPRHSAICDNIVRCEGVGCAVCAEDVDFPDFHPNLCVIAVAATTAACVAVRKLRSIGILVKRTHHARQRCRSGRRGSDNGEAGPRRDLYRPDRDHAQPTNRGRFPCCPAAAPTAFGRRGCARAPVSSGSAPTRPTMSGWPRRSAYRYTYAVDSTVPVPPNPKTTAPTPRSSAHRGGTGNDAQPRRGCRTGQCTALVPEPWPTRRRSGSRTTTELQIRARGRRPTISARGAPVRVDDPQALRVTQSDRCRQGVLFPS